MKDYYKILGIPENASQTVVKSAFRKLAFEHHPDKNPGNEGQAASRFKEINEAFAILGDKNKRQQYDYVRKNPFAGPGYNGFQYSERDIFQSIFNNQAFVNELNRMFSQAGLRFDRNFIDKVFSGGSSNIFRFYRQPSNNNAYQEYEPGVAIRKQNWLERILSKAVSRFIRFMLKRLIGIENTPYLDLNIEVDLTAEEIATCGEKEISYQRGKHGKKLIIKIPPSAKTGTRIRLKGMGLSEKNKTGDLYLNINVTKKTPA